MNISRRPLQLLPLLLSLYGCKTGGTTAEVKAYDPSSTQYGGMGSWDFANDTCASEGQRLPSGIEFKNTWQQIAAKHPETLNGDNTSGGYKAIWLGGPTEAGQKMIGSLDGGGSGAFAASNKFHFICVTGGTGGAPNPGQPIPPPNPPFEPPTPPPVQESDGHDFQPDSCTTFISAGACLDFGGGSGPYAQGCRWSSGSGKCFQSKMDKLSYPSCHHYSVHGSQACLDYGDGTGPYAKGCRWSSVSNKCLTNLDRPCEYYTEHGATACLDFGDGKGPYTRGCRWESADNSCYKSQ